VIIAATYAEAIKKEPLTLVRQGLCGFNVTMY